MRDQTTMIGVKLSLSPFLELSNLRVLLIKGLLLGVIQFNSISKCHLLITFTNSLDPDQARQDVGPDLDPNCLTL